MATTTAKTRQDVENMDKRERLWDSLDYSYGNMAEQSNNNFAKQISQQNASMLQRGMQRSSYGGQIEAGLRAAQVKAANDIEAQKIAAYEDRLGQLEQQEQEQANWEAQFNEGKRQFDEGMGLQREQFGYQKERDAVSDSQWERQFAAQQDQWKQEFDFNSKTTEQQYYANFVMSSIQAGNDPTDEMLAKAGLTRADADSMKAQVAAGGGGGYTKPTGNDDSKQTFGKVTDEAFMAGLSNNRDRVKTGTTLTPRTSEGVALSYIKNGLQKDLTKK